MIAILCDNQGQRMPGSDGIRPLDGRLAIRNQLRVAKQHREAYRKNFPHKCEFWTHVYFVREIQNIPDEYNGRSFPLYRLQ